MEWHLSVHATPIDYYNNGLGFCEAAWRCFGGREGIISQDGKLIQLPVQTVVNGAFACEMFLKALILHGGKHFSKGRDGHNLKTLFLLLDQNTQQLIACFCLPNGTQDAYSHFVHLLDLHYDDFTSKRYFMETEGWKTVSPMTMMTITENLSIITGSLLEKEEIEEAKESNE